MRLLITAANSDISISMARIVKSLLPDAILVGVAPDGNWPAAHYFDYCEPIQFVSEGEKYKQSLEGIIKKYEIDILCPISEKEMIFFIQENYSPIPHILINDSDLLNKCLDKYLTYKWLKSIQVPVPASQLLTEDKLQLQYPVIIKPRSSAGSKNMYIVNNDALFFALKQTHVEFLDHYILQHQVGTVNDEYTCALWRFNNDFRCLILKRKLQGGLTGEAEVIENKDIYKVLKKINDDIRDDYFINVQLRVEDEVPYVFEINPRFSSTIMMRNKIGFQDVVWTLFAKLGYKLPYYQVPKAGTKIFRMADELVIESTGI